jgi:SAM-dependent methyltransferase
MSTLLYVLTLTLVILIGIAIAAAWWLYWQLQPALHRGGPFVPTSMEKVNRMIALARLTRDDVVYDLGSGDGRFLFAAVKASGCRGVGVEIDPWLVNQSNAKAEELGLTDRVRFERGDLWKFPVADATVVFLFQLPMTMKGLEKKLAAELKPGTRIVSNYFVFPDWETVAEEGELKKYIR